MPYTLRVSSPNSTFGIRFLLRAAAIWSVMFLGIIAIDVGHAVSTGAQASHTVTEQIDYIPDSPGVLGTMERISRKLDKLGDNAFGRYVGLFEMLIYGVIAPLFIAGPLAWEARRRQCAQGPAITVIGLAGLVIGLWLFWKYPDAAAVYHALVNALLLCCRAVGLSYYTGSLVYFVILPPLFALGYGAVALWRGRRPPTGTVDEPPALEHRR